MRHVNHIKTWVGGVVLLVGLLMAGCGAPGKEDDDFFTSGSREADQRAQQRIAKIEQLRGEALEGDDVNPPLYDRLGGEQGMQAIVDDFITRALADPRVNWEREGIRRGGWNLLKRKQSMEWEASPENVANLKKHLAQFLALATGGPAQYQGRDMREVHRNLHISNAEFDAAIGDLKATLDNLGIPTDEQKELLSIVESTRPQVVERR